MRALIAFVSVLAAAAPASAQGLLAPGRVVMPSLGWEVAPNPDGGGGGLSVLLEDGGALLLADYDAHGRALHRMSRSGAITQRGPLQLPDSVRALGAHAMVRDAQGRVLLVLERRETQTFGVGRMLVVRLSETGVLDGTYGTDGVADTGVNVGCGACDDVAVAPDGSLLVTGSTDPGAPVSPGGSGRSTWAVARLTPSGQLDKGFDGDGVVKLERPSSAGFNIALLADGRIAAMGQEALPGGASRILLARLTAAGERDATYDGDGIVETPFATGFDWLVAGDGTLWVEGREQRRLARFTPAGALDPAFSGDGVTDLGAIGPLRLFADPGGAVTVVGTPAGASGVATPVAGTLTRVRVDSAGGVSGAGTRVTPSFGGGIHGQAFAQNSFRIGTVHRRSDGSLLLIGGVAVARYTGEGTGESVAGHAYASFTSGLAPDGGFGGPSSRRPRARASVPAQRAATIRRLRRVRVRVDAERPSLVEIEVRAGRRLLARGTVATLRPGVATHGLVVAKNRVSRARRGAVVDVRVRVRDLVRRTATVRVRGRLR